MENRLTDLEHKYSYQEMLLEQLNEVVTKQQMQLDRLTKELEHVRQTHLKSEGDALKDARDETPPPHY